MADIFQEVDEQVRKDRALELWSKYGGYVIGACIALVIATGLRVAWQDYSKNQRIGESTRFMAAVRLGADDKSDQAVRAFRALADDASTGYGALARLRAAAVLRESDKDEAIAIYDSVAESGEAGAALSGLARLSAVLLMVDDGDESEIERRLEPLLAGNGAWRPLALEIRAIVAYRDGDLAAAGEQFKTLANMAGAPAGVRQRAAGMLAAMGLDE